MEAAPEGTRLTSPPAPDLAAPDCVSDGDMVMAILASGGQILRHRIDARPPDIPLRFTLHAWPDGEGTVIERTLVRGLLAAGLVELGSMPPNAAVPRVIQATVRGVGRAVARVTAAYRTVIDEYGLQAVTLSTRQRHLVHRLYGDRELRLQQYAQDSFRLAEYPPPRRFDVEPLTNIGFLGSGDRQDKPVVWRLTAAGESWAHANPAS